MLPAQLSSSYRAQQRAAQRRGVPWGAVRCRAVPYLALWCGAVLCRTVLFFEHVVPDIMRSARYQVPVCTYVCARLFAFFIDCPPSRSSSRFFLSRKLHSRCRSERNIANKHTAHLWATRSAKVALGIIKSLVAPNHGPLLSAPFTC